MDNLKHFVLGREIKNMLDRSELPVYAKVSILKEATIEFEKEYFKAVELENKEMMEKQNEDAKKLVETPDVGPEPEK